MTKVAAVILTLNEEPRIKNCLDHIRPYIDYILVLDGESTDNTVEIARKLADEVIVKPFSGSFADEKNYARTLIPKDYTWILWVDADERFDIGFLRDLQEHLRNTLEEYTICWRFPRCNLPNGNNFPDYQVRLIKNSRDVEWRGTTHEVPYLKTEGIPLDQLDREGRRKILNVVTAERFPIIHLPRRTDETRSWW